MARNSSSSPAAPAILTRIQNRLFAPVDIASLVFFRVTFGALMAWEAWRYFHHRWIAAYWLQPGLLFKYYGFSWVHPWPGNGMYIHMAALGVLASFIAAGFLYRLSTLLFFLGFTYIFLLDQATYLNHFYLICLLSFLLIFVPAHRAFSVDSWLRPRLRSEVAPTWALWLLRAQLAIVYFYGGVAKIAPDWLRGEPMRAWMSTKTDFPLIGRFFREEWAVYGVSYGGLLLDLLIAPALLWRRTRIAALCVGILFHLINIRLFSIGVFPYLAIAATTLFLSPGWPRRLLGWFRKKWAATPEPTATESSPRHPKLILSLACLYLLIQLLVPLRHFLYPGRVDWTYEGHRFSWRMKLIDRQARARFYVTDPNSGRSREVNPRSVLRPHQTSKMASRPDMILQFAHHLARTIPYYGTKPLQVEARVLASVNGRKPEYLVNPNVNLAAEPRTLKHAHWLLPMTEPLPTNRSDRPKPVSADSAEASAE